MCTSISPDMLNDITTICNLPPETQIFRSIRKPSILLKVGHIQDLVSYGSETNDAILTFYLDMLCSSKHATYMSTAFWPHLKQYGWDRVQRYFASSQSGYYARKLDRPLKVGEPKIMIPIFINGNHWVALVRREFDGRVYFYYSDDMNQRSTETEVKHFIYNHTDQDFRPSDAQWVHCHSTHYINHSNECGPRTILALHTMAFHPHPYANMLLPLMDTNIAQISRTWIAGSIISGTPLHDSLTDTFTHTHLQDTRHSTTMQSHPYDIIPWKKINRDLLQVPTLPDNPKSSASSHTSNDGLLPGTYQSLNIPPTMVQGSSSTDNRNHNVPRSISIDGNYKNHHNSVQQTKITDFTCHRPFYSGIVPNDIQIDTESLLPEGYMPPMIDPTHTMRIIMQNPQYSLQLTNENVNTLQLTSNLKELSTAVFVAISPNINWHNPSHKAQFKHPFNRTFKQVHISATASDVGLLPNYKHTQTLTGGVAILTFDHWASKVCKTYSDPRGHGTYTTTTLQGKNGRFLTIIGAYISVLKGSKAGVNTVHSQQMYMMERTAMNQKKHPSSNLCPRREAIKALSSIISELQSQDHAIILNIDANQTPTECYTKAGIKIHTIEWLKTEHGLDDPFLMLHDARPSSTTITPNRDIDYILTYGVSPQHITLLPIDFPTNSDHRGLCIDINIAEVFQANYSELSNPNPRKLSLRNVQSKIAYIKHISKQLSEHNILEKVNALYQKAVTNKSCAEDELELNALDRQVTEILLTGERLCAKDNKARNPWSPTILITGGTLTYWKNKMRMVRNKNIQWRRLDRLRNNLDIPDDDHRSLSIDLTREKLRNARRAWREAKCASGNLREQFLIERAEEYAIKMRTDKVTALKMIKSLKNNDKHFYASAK
jgi:hypothetical protein